MHIETWANKVTLALAVLLFHVAAVAQSLDTIDLRPFERYWTQPRLVPKLGFGIQETGFAEVGLQWHQIYVHPPILASAGPYLTVDAIFNDDQFIIGPKVGYEISAGLLGLAADVTYYSDFKRDAFVFTPRAGISVLGFVNLFYGRNISLSDYLFDEVDKNRFSLVFNLNRDYFNIREAPKKRDR